MFAPVYCNLYEIQSMITESNHELVVLKFFYQEPKMNIETPFPKIPYAPVAVIMLEKKRIKQFLRGMQSFLVQLEEHGRPTNETR